MTATVEIYRLDDPATVVATERTSDLGEALVRFWRKAKDEYGWWTGYFSKKLLTVVLADGVYGARYHKEIEQYGYGCKRLAPQTNKNRRKEEW